MNKKIVIAFILSLGLISNSFSNSTETEKALTQLNQQIEILNTIKRFTDRNDHGRLMVLTYATTQTKETIERVGLVHTATLNEYLKQYIIYRSTTTYFKHILTEYTRPQIETLYTVMDDIAKERGLDDFSFNKFTYNTYSQMWNLLQELLKMQISEELKAEIENLTVDFGHLLAISAGGDNIPTFEAGKEMYFNLEKIYPVFFKVSAQSPVYDIILNIQGLNELYAEYARIK